VVENTEKLEKIEDATLPVGKEKNTFHAQELKKWIKWIKFFFCRHVEQN
jgi:hypothetical protein